MHKLDVSEHFAPDALSPALGEHGEVLDLNDVRALDGDHAYRNGVAGEHFDIKGATVEVSIDHGLRFVAHQQQRHV